MNEKSRYRLGLLLVTGSAVAWSTAGFFTRLLANFDTWTLLLWRGVFGALGVGLFMAFHEPKGIRSSIRDMGYAAWALVLAGTIGMYCFIASLRLTTVAHVSIIYATVPLMAAALAWLVMREKASMSALIASVVTIVGVAVIVGLGTEGNRLCSPLKSNQQNFHRRRPG